MGIEVDLDPEPAGVDARVIADERGAHVALVERDRVGVLDVPRLEPVSEIGLDASSDHDVVFVGDPGRLAVLVRGAPESLLHVVDPTGPNKLGEVRFRGAARIAAVSGRFVLVTSSSMTAVIDVARPESAAAALPVRGVVSAAGATEPDHFLLALGGSIEEWNAETRTPTWRLRVDRPLDLEHVGGNAHRIWMIARSARDRLDVITLATRSTRRVDLPEPPRHVAVHASGDVLAMTGARTRSGYIIRLSREPSIARLERPAISDAAWLGRGATLAVKPLDGPLELETIALSSEEVRGGPAASERASGELAPPVNRPAVVDAEPVTRWSREEISSRLAAWRNRFAGDSASDSRPPSRGSARPATGPVALTHPGGWRAELAAWARAMRSGSPRDMPAQLSGVLDEVTTRLELAPELRPALALTYGAYLGGAGGVAILELASVIDWCWEEAVGNGRLAESGALRWRKGLVELEPAARAALDERRALTGRVIEAPVSTHGAVAIVAPAEISPWQVATWAAPQVGGLLVPDARGERRPKRFLFEAKLRGVAPLVPWDRFRHELDAPPAPAAILVEHAALASHLDLPVVATWIGATGG